MQIQENIVPVVEARPCLCYRVLSRASPEQHARYFTGYQRTGFRKSHYTHLWNQGDQFANPKMQKISYWQSLF